MKGLRLLLLFIAIIGLALGPAVVSAADFLPIVKCGATGQAPCTPCDIFGSLKNIIDFILKGVTGPVAAFMIVFSGGMMLLGGGKPALYGKGKEMLTSTLIGVTIILLAWVVTNFLIRALMPGVSTGSSWFEFSCPVGLASIAPVETSAPTNLPPPPPTPQATTLTPQNLGAAFSGVLKGGESGGGANTGGATYPYCPAEVACTSSAGTCPKLRPALEGTSNPRLLESIMARESSCRINPPPSGAGAYGLMQIQPATANGFRGQCGVREQITASWLQSEQNLEKIICIADVFVASLQRACGTSVLNLAAGYNGGPGACGPSRDCKTMLSCVGDGQPMRKWECPYSDSVHLNADQGFLETRRYAPKVAACAQ